MKNKAKVDLSGPKRCEVSSCNSLQYDEGLCSAHFKLSHDPKVRIAYQDYLRRQDLNMLTGKKPASSPAAEMKRMLHRASR